MTLRFRALACASALALCAGACAVASQHTARTPSGAEWCAQTGSTCAWWVTAVFTPMDSVVEGIPVNRIRSDWERASVLTRAMMPLAAVSDPSNLADTSRTGFVHDADFNGDGVVDRALVGVFRTRRGVLGRFLLILSPAAGASRRIAFVAAIPAGYAGFSVLDWRSANMTWATCMECDALAILRWERGKYLLDNGSD